MPVCDSETSLDLRSTVGQRRRSREQTHTADAEARCRRSNGVVTMSDATPSAAKVSAEDAPNAEAKPDRRSPSGVNARPTVKSTDTVATDGKKVESMAPRVRRGSEIRRSEQRGPRGSDRQGRGSQN
jgi:hypothetical protein